MIDTNETYYTSNYVLDNSTFNSSPFQKYDETIAKLEETNLNLEILRDCPGQTEEMKAKIQEAIDRVDHCIEEFVEIRFKTYEECIYKYKWYSPKGVKSMFFKQVKGDNCDGCAFKHMPCLGIRSHYGCYTTPEHSPNNELCNGELIKTGHFAEIDSIKIKSELEKFYGGPK